MIYCRTLSDDIMKFLTWLFELPGLTPDLFNGAILFRRWLDEGNPLKNRATTPSKAELDKEDLHRKDLLQTTLLAHLSSSHYGVPYIQSYVDERPSLKAASMIHDSPEALDALTKQKYIVREEGNYAAHNLLSLERFSKALSGSSGDHMAAGPTEAMNVFVSVFLCIPHPTLPPPAGSTLWSMMASSDPEWLSFLASEETSSPPEETSPPVLAPALSSSSHRGNHNHGRSAKARLGKSKRGTRGGAT